MESIEHELQTVVELIRTVNDQDAEKRLRSLIESLPPLELAEQQTAIRTVIDRFLKKRRRRLTAVLEQRLDFAPHMEAVVPDLHGEVKELRESVRTDLIELADRHIYQWNTFYSEVIEERFAQARALVLSGASASEVGQVVYDELQRHSTDIVQRGYAHTSSQPGSIAEHALSKTLRGLQRFLELPMEVYARRVRALRSAGDAGAIRTICSSMLAGIVEGYAEARLGQQSGSQILQRYWQLWIPIAGYLTTKDMGRLAAAIGPGTAHSVLCQTVRPVG